MGPGPGGPGGVGLHVGGAPGVLVDAAGLPGFMALVEGRPVGLLTYARRDDEVEIVTLHVEQEGGGAGRAGP